MFGFANTQGVFSNLIYNGTATIAGGASVANVKAGFVGGVNSNQSAANLCVSASCYYNSTTDPYAVSPISNAGGGSVSTTNIIGVTSGNFSSVASFPSLDFTNYWTMTATGPALRTTQSNNLYVVARNQQDYYGNTPAPQVSYFGLQGSDSAATVFSSLPTVTTTATSTTPAGTNSSMTVTVGTLSSASYLPTYISNGSLYTAPRPVTVTGTVVADKVYTASTGATITGGTLSGLVNGDTLTLTQAGSFAQSAVGTGISVTINDSISGTGASNYVIVQPTGLTGNITPKPLTINGGTVASRAYDGTTVATMSGNATLSSAVAAGTTTVDGRPFSGDTVSLVFGSATFAQANVGTGINVSRIYSLTGASAGNYTLSPAANLTANITAKALTVTGTTVPSKIYDKTTTSPAPTIGTVTGFVGNETLTITGSASSLAGSPVGSYLTTVTYTLANGSNGGLATNYSLANSTSIPVTITAKPLFVSGLTVPATKVYDGTTTITVSGTKALLASQAAGTGSTSDGKPYTGDTVSLTGTATLAYNTADVGSNKSLIISGLSLTGANATNYSLNTTAQVTSSITAKPLTLSGVSVSGKTYDATTTASLTGSLLAAEAAGTGTTSDGKPYTRDSLTLASSGTFASANAGNNLSVTGTFTLSGPGASNYSITQPTGLTATISKAALTITASGLTKNYDGNAFSGGNGVTYSGFVAGETSSVLGGTLAYSGTSQGASDAGNYLITPTGLTSPNYTLSSVSGALTINKVDATVIANSDVYTYNGQARSASGFTAYGLVNGQTASVLTGVSLSGGGTNAGSYPVSVTGTDRNYNLTLIDGTMTINKAQATVTATSASVTYDGQAHSGSGFSVTGLVNGQTASVLTGVSVTGGGTNAGSYPLVAGGSDPNYALSFTDGTLTITKAPLTVAAVADSKTYNGQPYTGGNGVTYAGLVNGETSAVLGGALVYGGSAQGATHAGTYAITPSGLTASNYDITYADAALTINKAPLTVTAANASKTYDGQVFSGQHAVTYAGFVNGETDAVLAGTLVYGGSAKSAINAGSYTIAPTGLSSNNYAISYANGTLTIDKANATVTVNSDSYVYNGQARAPSGFTASGLVNGETEAVLTGVVMSGGGTHAGTYATSASGSDANYNLTFVPGTMTIAKAPLVITAINDAKFITQTDAPGYLGVSYTGLVNGETAAVLTTAPTVTRSNAGVDAIGHYSGVLQASGASSPDYDISYVAGHYTIVPAGQLLVRVAPASLTYGGTENYTIASAKYLDSNNRAVADLTSRTSVTGGNAVSMTDGYGGSASFTIGASTPATSTSGYLKVGGYNVDATSVSTTSTHFSNQLTVVGSLQVDPAPVTAGVAATSKTYDGSAAAGTVALTVAGTLGQDVVTGTGLGLYDNKMTGIGKGMTATSLMLGGADAGNYYIVNSTATGSAGTITRKAVTVSGITAPDKIYDGTKAANPDTASALLSGVVVGDDVSVSATGTFSDKTVGTSKTVTLASQYSGADAGNYVFTSQTSTTASITAKTLTLSGITATDKVYDGTRTATLDGSLAVAGGLVAGDSVSVSATGDFDNRNAGSGKLVSVSPSLSGSDAANYVIGPGQTTTTASITPAPLTLSGAANVNKTYDGTVAMPAGVSGYGALGGVIGTDTVSLSGTPVYQSAKAGAAVVTQGSVGLSGADAGNYSLNWINGSGVIAKAQATVTGNSSSVTYDGTLHVVSGFSATGLVNGETAAVLTGVTATGSGKNAGSYAVTPSGSADNYNLTFVDGTLAVAKANLTVTANADSKTYSGLQYSGGNGVTYSGFVAGESRADLTGAVVYGGTAQGAVNAGTYSLTASGLLSNNYAISYQPANLTIAKAPLQVIANPDAKFITQSDGALYGGVSYAGFVNGETATVLTSAPTVSRSNTGVESPGTYSGVLQASGGAADNYTFSYVAGDYTIVPAGQLLVKMANASQTYGGNASYAVASAQYLDRNGNGIIDLKPNAVVSGASVSISDGVGGTASFSVAPTAPSLSSSGRINVGHYAVDASSINNTSGNFSNTLTVLGSLDVSPVALTATTTAVSKIYDGSVAAGSLSLALSGVLAGDTVTASGTGLFASKSVGTGKTVTVSGLDLAGADAGNYALSNSSVSGNTGEITPKTLIVSGISAANKIYDRGLAATVSTASASLNGLVAGDDVSVTATGVFATSSAATGKTVTLTSAYAGADVGNYAIIDQTTTLASITPKSVTLAGSTAVTRAYDGTRAMPSGVSGYGSLSGVIAGDSVSVTGAAVFAGSEAGSHAVQQGTAALSGADRGNYVLDWTDGSGSITKAPLTVTATNASKTYDGLAYSGGNGVSVSGLVNGETSAVLSGSVGYGGTSRGAIHAGTYTITPSGLSSSNYAISYVDGTLTVAKAVATVTAESPTYVYSGVARQATAFTATGLVNGETTDVLTGVTVSGGGTNAGLYTTTATGTDRNYTLQFVDGTMTIGKAQATVTASTDRYVYNGLTRVASGFSATGLVNGETSAVLTGVSVAGGGKNAGTYTTTASGTDANYTLTFANGQMSIDKAPLTVTVLNKVKTYDGLAFSGGNGVSMSGLVNGETSAVLGGALTYGGTAQGAIHADLYSLTASGLTSSNYTLSYTAGLLSVTKANATVTAASDNYVYNGQTRTASGFSVTGLVNGETNAVLTGVTVAGGGKNAGTYTTTASGSDSNYALSFVDGQMTISKAPLTVTAANDSKTYNGLAYAGGNGASYSGLVPGETSAVLSDTLTYGGTAQGARQAGTYGITPAGLGSSNYDISYVDGTLTIAKTNATVTAASDHYVYNGLTRVASGFSATGLVNGETSAVLTGVSVAGGGKNAGTYTTTASGTDANYTLTFVDGQMSIQPKNLSISGSTVAGRDYDGTRALVATAGNLSGLVGAETLAVTVSAMAASKDAGTQTASLTYALSDGTNGGLASNYTLADTLLPVTIAPKALTVSGSTVSDRVYDGTRGLSSSAGTLSGLIGSEQLSVTSTATAASKNAGAQTAVLVYSLSDGANGGKASNYAVADASLPVMIAQKDLTVVGTVVATKTFDGKTDAAVSGGVLVGVVGGDQIGLIQSGTFTSSTAGLAVPVVINDQITGIDVANYRLLQPQGITGTINANTPILYPSVPVSSPMVNQPLSSAPVSTGAGGGWSVEVKPSANPSGQSSETGRTVSQSSAQAGTSTLVIKANSETGSIQTVPDYLSVGRAVVFDAVQGNPTIVGATISFAKGFEAGKTLLELSAVSGIKAQIDNDSGKIILSGSASVGEYNRVVQTLRMKLNGADKRRVIAMNLSLVDQGGNRETRLITLKPFESGSQAGIDLRLPLMVRPEAMRVENYERLGAVVLPGLEAARIE